jgi:hypothetical protein
MEKESPYFLLKRKHKKRRESSNLFVANFLTQFSSTKFKTLNKTTHHQMLLPPPRTPLRYQHYLKYPVGPSIAAVQLWQP